MSENPNPAGGRATETGMAFQAAVTTWFAAQMLADAPVGSVFGLPAELKVSGLQCETGDAIDDLVVRLSHGGPIYVQCKTRPVLARDADSDLGKALAQVVKLYSRTKSSPPHELRAVLAVAENAPRTLENLNFACRLFDHGGTWGEVFSRATDQVRDALALFERHVRAAWPRHFETPLEPTDLVSLARMFQLHRFPEDAGSDGWRNAAHLLGRALYGSEGAGEGSMSTLLALSRNFIRTGAPVDRNGALRGLRAAGHLDISAPGYDKDITALRGYSEGERSRLSKHKCLPIDGGVPISRDCLAPLRGAAEAGSLLVTGEPGAGKTGVLLALADQLGERGPVVFLSVERLSGVRTRSDVRQELGLDRDLLDVLSAWPGVAPGVVIIDALDASRGGPSEAVIASLIEDAVRSLGSRWSIVASIRSFDLRNGRRFREIMRGNAPNPAFAENGLGGVRHFCVPRLSLAEVSAVAAASRTLRDLERAAPDKLRDLLRNIFNLSLAAELLDSGEDPNSIRSVSTQSELIWQYEEVRLPTQPLRLAAKAAVQTIVQRRQLTVRATDIECDAIDDLRRSGVLTSAGDRVAFPHHVLFDHVAARFYLSWDDAAALRAQITHDPTLGLMLAPALRFALEQMWQSDIEGRPTIWGFLMDLAGVEAPDPVVLSIALRTAAERVSVPSDVQGLCALIQGERTAEPVSRVLGQLARFVGIAAADGGGLSPASAEAWARVATVGAETRVGRHADAARVLLMTVAEQSDLSSAAVLNTLGTAARALLTTAWSLSPGHPALTTTGIRLVAKSYGTDPDASRALLSRILEDRFEEHAPQEAMWLAEGVGSIVPHDPDFVARIYATMFAREVNDTTKTWLGGSPSRILPLTSTRRQDYDHALWRLTEELDAVLEAAPRAGTAGVIGAVQGLTAAKRERTDAAPPAIRLNIGDTEIQVVDEILSLSDWRERRHGKQGPLDSFVRFLQSCPRDAFRTAVAAAMELPANTSVWARLLGVAAERPDVADDLLWPLAAEPRFAGLAGVSRDAVIFLAAAYPRQSFELRQGFERAALAPHLFPDDRESAWWASVLRRFLSVVPAEYVATPEMRARQSELGASGELTGNPPYMSVKTGWGSGDIVDRLLRSQGADLERSPEREIRAASQRIEAALKSTPEDEDQAASLALLWDQVVGLIKLLADSAAQGPHPELVHSSWGAVSNAVERVAKSPAYAQDGQGQPSLDELLAVIDRLSASEYPERTDDDTSDAMSWGNWDVRVYAASSLVALAPRFAGVRPDIVERMAECLRDRTPAVRLQVAGSLNVLWDVAKDGMWSLVHKVADEEIHEGVLRFFVAGSLSRLADADPAKCAQVFDRVVEREWADRHQTLKSRRSRETEAFADVALRLYVARDQSLAWKWIELWASEMRFGAAYVVPMLHELRSVFFFPYAQEPVPPRQAEMASRTRRLLDLVVTAGLAAVKEARPHLLGNPTNDAVEAWRPLYEAGDSVLAGVCAQFYFGSGAHRSQGDREPVGLPTSDAKRRFLSDHAGILDAVATHAQANTVHQLFELLSYLVDGDPPAVFDRIAGILLGPAAEDGYQFESLGLDSLVKLVRLYLADYREIFDDAVRRRTLVAVLELFSSAGWPDALKLLFELPDLLR